MNDYIVPQTDSATSPNPLEIQSNIKSVLRAYECIIEDVDYYEPVHYYGDYIGSVRESIDCWGIYYATTPSKAKHQFIVDQKARQGVDLEYTDPIKVRLLAKNVNDTGNPFLGELGADWCKADLTIRGQELISNWVQAEEYMMSEANQL